MHDTTVLRALALGFAALASCAAEAPVLDSIQLIGGSGIDTVHRVAADGNGHIYVLGTTASADFPATLRLGPSGLFVAKIRMSDWGLVFASVIGSAEPIGLALDPAGNAYVSGRTDRPAAFPTTEDALRRQLDGQTSVLFALKLGASDGALVYSTFLTGYVSGGAIAVNSSGEAYIAGIGTRNTVPLTTSRVIGGDGGGGAFLLRLSADGRTLVYGSLLAASVHVSAIALDTRQNVYMAGRVESTSGLRATPGSAQTEFAGAGDAFVMKVRAAGEVVELATFLGGAGGDGAGFLHVGDDGSIYIAGDCEQGTASGLEKPFPTTADAPFRRFGLFRGFFAKLDGSTAALVFSTYLTDKDNWYTSAAQASAVTSSGVAVAYVVRAGRGFPGLNFFPRGELDAARVITFGVDGRVIGDPWLVPGISPRAMSAAGDEILIAGASGFINAPLPPGLRPIGPANADPERSAFQQAHVAVAKYSTSLPATHGIDTDRGYIRVSESIFTLTDPSAGQLELTSPEGAVPFRIYEPMPRGCCSEPRPYTASPLEGTTPAVITIRKTGSGSEPAPLLVASARSREALQMIPITTMSFSVSLQASLTVSLQARESDEPVETNLPVNSRVTDNTTLEELNVGVPFSILPDSVPSWLKVQPLSGTTPATVILRATAGLSPGQSRVAFLELLGGQSRTRVSVINFRPAPLTGPAWGLPSSLRFNFVAGTGARAFTYSFAGPEGHSFHIVTSSNRLIVTPESGTGPATLALVIDPTKFPVGVSTESFEVRSDTGTATVVITITITAPEIRVQPYISYVRGPSELSPGARILVGIVGLDLPDEKWSDISPAPRSWDGLSFRYGSNALPIVASRGAGSFAVQFPYELEVGGSPQRLELFSERDGVLASAPIFGKIAAASIGLVDLGPATVFREDGSAIAADNPARPGERIRISAVGAGIMEPRVSAGELPSDGMTARPLLPITASVSGKSAPVVRQILSATRIGVVDLEIEVPSVYSGKHMLGLMQGNSYVYAIPLHVER